MSITRAYGTILVYSTSAYYDLRITHVYTMTHVYGSTKFFPTVDAYITSQINFELGKHCVW